LNAPSFEVLDGSHQLAEQILGMFRFAFCLGIAARTRSLWSRLAMASGAPMHHQYLTGELRNPTGQQRL
jgi:hypothetical protein